MLISAPCKVIGEHGLLRDKPGFEVDLITRGSSTDRKHKHNRPSVLMPVKGHWRVDWDGGRTTLAPGDVFAVPPGIERSLHVAMSGEASLFRVRNTDDEAGPTMNFFSDSRPEP